MTAPLTLADARHARPLAAELVHVPYMVDDVDVAVAVYTSESGFTLPGAPRPRSPTSCAATCASCSAAPRAPLLGAGGGVRGVLRLGSVVGIEARRKGSVGAEQWAAPRREHFVGGVSIKELRADTAADGHGRKGRDQRVARDVPPRPTELVCGFTLLSRLAVQVEERSGQIAVLTVISADLRREPSAVRLRQRRPEPVGLFWAFLQAAAPDRFARRRALRRGGEVIASPAGGAGCADRTA